MDFTKEQQEHIDKLIEDRVKGLYTKEDLDRQVTAEVDRRVQSGIEKGLETHKKKWKKEFQKEAELTAEELAQKKLDEKLDEVSQKESEINKKSNILNARDMLTQAEIPKKQYEKMLDVLVTDDGEATTENVQNFIDTFNETKTQIESTIKKEYSIVDKPKVGSNQNKGISKEEFRNMTYLEQVELKQKDEELYNKLRE